MMRNESQQEVKPLKFHPESYRFIMSALNYAQDQCEGEIRHINAMEMMRGVVGLGHRFFGLLTETVFNQWGYYTTDDFGFAIFELIDRGALRKTEEDSITDFDDLFDFGHVLTSEYYIDTRMK